MLKECRRQLYIFYKFYAYLLPIFFGFALFISTMVYVGIGYFGGERELFELGTLSLHVLIGMEFMFIQMLGLPTNYNLALKTGIVRKNYITVHFLTSITLCFIMMLLSNAWHFVDGMIASAMGLVLTPLYRMPVVMTLAVSAMAVIAGTWLGALIFKYGRNGFWAAYVIFMAAMLGSARITSLLEDENSFLSRAGAWIAQLLGRQTNVVLSLAASVFVALLTVHAYFLMYYGEARD